MERKITRVERSKVAHARIALDADTGEEIRRSPVTYYYHVYYSTARKPTNCVHMSAYSEEEAIQQALDKFESIDSRRNKGAKR